MENSFKVSPRILAHLGEDLIKNESIALLELVKNSYDACSTKCVVEFTMKDSELQKISISDNGLGMNIDIINNVWLVIGTDNKKDTTQQRECDRIPLGEKGIGRLGVHKLGKKIKLVSKKNNYNEITLFIDWNKLENSKELDDFKIITSENPNPEYFTNSTGTYIEITDLNADWDRRQLREVYRAVNSLNSPFDETNEDFKVSIKSNSDIFKGLPDFNDIKKAALYFANCKIENDKIINISYEFKPWSSLTRIQSGRRKSIKDFDEFQLKLSKRRGQSLKPISLEEFDIGPVEFEVAIFDFDSQLFNYVSAITEKKSVKDYLRENGGIKVFRDGVRVYDYGEEENDWLGIDLRRVHRVGGNISNHIVIGAVKLMDRSFSKSLKEKTNREGFVENDAYIRFKDAVNFALDLIVNERNIDKERLSMLYKKHKSVEPVLSDLNEVVEIVKEKIEDETTCKSSKYFGLYI